MRFIIIDDFLQQHQEIEAGSVQEAAEKFADSQGREDCLSPALVQVDDDCSSAAFAIPDSVMFTDEGSHLGWGSGCKFDGQSPKHQLIFRVVPRN